MLEPLRNPVNWDNFRKVAVLVLILWAAASVLFGIIYFFILGGRSPAPANIFRALILLVPFIAQADSPDRPRSAGDEAGGGGGLGQEGVAVTSASSRAYTCGSGRTQDCDRAGTSEASSNWRSVISLAAACVQDNASFSK